MKFSNYADLETHTRGVRDRKRIIQETKKEKKYENQTIEQQIKQAANKRKKTTLPFFMCIKACEASKFGTQRNLGKEPNTQKDEVTEK